MFFETSDHAFFHGMQQKLWYMFVTSDILYINFNTPILKKSISIDISWYHTKPEMKLSPFTGI